MKKSAPISCRFTLDMLDRIDALRGSNSRSRFLELAVEQRVDAPVAPMLPFAASKEKRVYPPMSKLAKAQGTLWALQNAKGWETLANLCTVTGYPREAVKQHIRDLRKRGHNIRRVMQTYCYIKGTKTLQGGVI